MARSWSAGTVAATISLRRSGRGGTRAAAPALSSATVRPHAIRRPCARARWRLRS